MKLLILTLATLFALQSSAHSNELKSELERNVKAEMLNFIATNYPEVGKVGVDVICVEGEVQSNYTCTFADVVVNCNVSVHRAECKELGDPWMVVVPQSLQRFLD